MKQRKYTAIDFNKLNKEQLMQLLDRDTRGVVRNMKYRGYIMPLWIEEYIMEHCEDLWTYTNSYSRLSSMIKFDILKEEYILTIDNNILDSVPESILRKFIESRIGLFTPDLIRGCSPLVRCIYMEIKLTKK